MEAYLVYWYRNLLSINNINPSFMKQCFQLRKRKEQFKTSIKEISVTKCNHVCYGEKRLRYYEPEIWNSFPFNVNTSEILTFKDTIKNLNGVTCNCRVCQS